VIYKIAEVTSEEGVFVPTMKFSEKKVTLPGRKQVFRIRDKKGFYVRDIIGLEDEVLGEPLLKKVMQAGEVMIAPQSAATIRETALKNLSFLKKQVKALHEPASYPVKTSAGLQKLIKNLTADIKKRQQAAIERA
jgi:nicotinate phosphoribosyltransferase